MKTFATILLAGLIAFAPLQSVQAAPPADFETEIASLKTQIQLLELRLAKLEAGEKITKSKAEIRKEKKQKKLEAKKQKDMNDSATGATALPEEVVKLDATWAEREAELDAKYKTPGKWKLVDEKGIRDFKKYQEKREALLSK